MKGNKIIILICLLLLLKPIHAFRPVAHVILQRTITQQLPADNKLKIVMDSFPEYAAWGSVGPDIAYIPFKPLGPKWGYKRKIVQLINNANLFHYHKSADFSRLLLKKALQSEDKRLIAFAAGWLTHVAGDFNAHKTFIYPEAGYYISDEEGRGLHGELEQYAEAIIFIEKGRELNQNKEFYREENLEADILYDNFFKQPLYPFSGGARRKVIEKDYQEIMNLLDNTFDEVYGKEIETNFFYAMHNYDEAFGKGLTIEKFSLKSYKNAQEYFGEDSTLLKHLNKSFDDAVQYGLHLLNEADKSNYSSFTGAWNLDVGMNTHTLVVKCKIGEEPDNGSWRPIDITFELDRKRKVAINYGDFRLFRYKKGDVLYTYWLLESCKLRSNKIYSFYLSKGGLFKDRTIVKELTIYHNGKVVFYTDESIELRRKHPRSKRFAFKETLDLSK